MADNSERTENNQTPRSHGPFRTTASPAPSTRSRRVPPGNRPRPPPIIQRSSSGLSQQSDDSSRHPRSRRVEITDPADSADETTRLLTEDHSTTVRQSHSESRERHRTGSLRAPSLLIPARSVRHRASTLASVSRSPYRSSRRSTIVPSKSVAIAFTTARDNNHNDDAASHRYSLAGPTATDTIAANQTYVDPGYSQLNPAYEQPSNARPVWGLAKPLPRVLRPGMVPTTSEIRQEWSHHHDQEQDREHEQKHVDPELEQGRIEPSLRLDISSQLDQVRQEREIQLFENYRDATGFSPSISRMGRRTSDTTAGMFSPRAGPGDPIPEEEEEGEEEETERGHDHHVGPDLSHLSEAIAQVEEAKAYEVPYEDAIPLKAYEALDDEVHNLHTYWSVVRLRFREPLAELLAITVQLTLGFSTNLAITVSRGRAGVGDTSDWAWGLATMIAIYIAGGISGAHLNPAMSIMLYIYRGFPMSRLPSYITAQLLGAFLAALIAFGIFQPGIIALGEANLAKSGTSDNFITFPRQDWVDGSTAFLTELVGTTILAISVLALGDDANAPPGAGMNAFIIGLVIVVLSMAFGWNTGLAMNPARDFGPRLALLVLGYGGKELFSNSYWFTVAWLGPLTGAILGGFLYDAAIFVGGESPVNYPPKRIKRATRKWKQRWGARLRRTKRKLREVKDDTGYGTMDGA